MGPRPRNVFANCPGSTSFEPARGLRLPRLSMTLEPTWCSSLSDNLQEMANSYTSFDSALRLMGLGTRKNRRIFRSPACRPYGVLNVNCTADGCPSARSSFSRLKFSRYFKPFYLCFNAKLLVSLSGFSSFAVGASPLFLFCLRSRGRLAFQRFDRPQERGLCGR
ncbi:hypothetical protein BV25DRAFT_754511 [Artomyces pyxidatus]|uniref:Uncharacterized protein n=1 Tax=Artomyces pyxidatus TaxID=48021 RepID=A0ACB8T0A5_9AGAM|nr:hypothetical protein BV25DRAFT_754511 [Artomyces pyxidatus]